MHSLRPALLLIGGLLLLLPGASRAQELDDDDKAFLNDVVPLILPDERAVFETLEDKADRLVFQEVFWARRDPDLATPQNEFREQYEKDRATADRRYSVRGAQGSTTDCGRLFILFGQPDEIERDPRSWTSRGLDANSPGFAAPPQPARAVVSRDGEILRQPFGVVRWPEVWIYKDRPDRRLQPARVEIVFDHECQGRGSFAQELDRIAATKIVHPGVDYTVGEDGRLLKPADQVARASATDGPREDH